MSTAGAIDKSAMCRDRILFCQNRLWSGSSRGHNSPAPCCENKQRGREPWKQNTSTAGTFLLTRATSGKAPGRADSGARMRGVSRVLRRAIHFARKGATMAGPIAIDCRWGENDTPAARRNRPGERLWVVISKTFRLPVSGWNANGPPAVFPVHQGASCEYGGDICLKNGHVWKCKWGRHPIGCLYERSFQNKASMWMPARNKGAEQTIKTNCESVCPSRFRGQ